MARTTQCAKYSGSEEELGHAQADATPAVSLLQTVPIRWGAEASIGAVEKHQREQRKLSLAIAPSSLLGLRLPQSLKVNPLEALQKQYGSSSQNETAVAAIYDSGLVQNYGTNVSGFAEFLPLIKTSAETAQKDYGKPFVIMEIGVLHGDSMAQFLNVHPNLYAIGVDPWVLGNGYKGLFQRLPERQQQLFHEPQGWRQYADYNIRRKSNESDHSHSRFVTVTGYAPEAVESVFNTSKTSGLNVSVFYVDGRPENDPLTFTSYWNKTLSLLHAHNSEAVILGDDYSLWYCPDLLQGMLKAFASRNPGMELVVCGGRTWALGKDLGKSLKGSSTCTWKVDVGHPYGGPDARQLLEKATQQVQRAKQKWGSLDMNNEHRNHCDA